MRPPPPISVWGHVWRWTLVLVISAIAWADVFRWQWDHARGWMFADLAVGVACAVLTIWRRRFPLTVAVVTNAASGFAVTAAGPATLALFSLATRRRWTEILPTSAVALLASLVALARHPTANDDTPFGISFALTATILAITVGWGMYVGSRRELLETLRERAETAEAEQEARVARARVAERARIAREMHDVLAHRISTLTMHAGALAFREDLPPQEVRATARTIEDNARLALVELREVLGVLRTDPGDADPEPPQPTSVAIPGLLDEFAAGGTRITPEFRVDLAEVPGPIGRTAYRIVQEGLTNAQKHAPDAHVTVQLGGGPDEGLTISISNLLPIGSSARDRPPGAGLGLVGLTERAHLAGGTLTHASTGGVHVLRVWLPWTT